MSPKKLTLKIELQRMTALAGVLVGIIVQVCCLWFIDPFIWGRDIAAYIPFFAWGANYTNAGGVLNAFYGTWLFGGLLLGIAAYQFGRLK